MHRTVLTILFVLNLASASVRAEFIDYAVIPDAVCIEFSDPELVGDILLNGKPADIIARGRAQAIVRAVGPGKIYAGESTLEFEPFVARASATANVTVKVVPVPDKPGHATAIFEGKSKEELIIIAPPGGNVTGDGVWKRTTSPAFVPMNAPPGGKLELKYITPDGKTHTESLSLSEPSVEDVSEDEDSGAWLYIGGGVLVAGGGAAVIASDSGSSSSSGGGGTGGSGGGSSEGGGSSSSSTCSESDFYGTWEVPGAEAEFGYAIGITFSPGGLAFVFADSDGGGDWSLSGCTVSVASGVDPFESCSRTVSPGATTMTLCGHTLVKK